jgi:hypothetical protein
METLSLAILEILVHLKSSSPLAGYVVFTVFQDAHMK